MKTVQSMLAEADAEVPRISPDEAKGLVGRADVLFLDVREPAEVAASGKVPGALAVPRGLVEFRADPASALHDKAFDRAKTVVAYCASGGRSALVGKTLKDMGYSNVKNLGGFKGWVDAAGEMQERIYDVAWSGDRQPEANGKFRHIICKVERPDQAAAQETA